MSVNWKIINLIKNGVISYKIGDKVIVFRRKSNGYPRGLKDDDEYYISRIENDSLMVANYSIDGVGWTQPYKVHKTYMISKEQLRDLKIDLLLK